MPVLAPPEEKIVKLKVCLVGEFAVGKTSLANRYIHDTFSGRYMATVGAKIQKANVNLKGSRVDLILWDIMGEKGFRELLREAYFEGANGLLAVTDLTRRGDLAELNGWINAVYHITGRIPLVIVGNKSDLTEHIRVEEADLAAFAQDHRCPYFITSAKTGENVDIAFRTLAEAIVPF